MIVHVGSENKAKVRAVENAFARYYKDFEVVTIDVDPGVSPQPTTLEEIVLGAKNRATGAFGKCNYSVGLEAGIFPFPGTHSGYMDLCVSAVFDGHDFYMGGSPLFEYPNVVVDKILHEGKEIGFIFPEMFKSVVGNIKEREGAIGLLSKNVVPRDRFMEMAVLMSLVQVVNREAYE